MKKVRHWLLGILALVAAMAFIAMGVAWWAFGSEAGTRWLVGKAVEFIEADVEIRGTSGTLWHGVSIEHITYADADRVIELDEFALGLDWSSITLSHVGVDSVRTQRLSVASIGESASETEPLSLEIPPLPVSFYAANVDIQLVEVDSVEASEISIRDVDVDGLQVIVASAGATVHTLTLRLDSFEAELRENVSVSTGFSWQMADGSWSGDGAIDGDLHVLQLDHELRGDYPLHTSGTVDLSMPGQPRFDVVSTFAEWRYEEWVASDATVRLVGQAQDYQAELALSVFDGGQISARVNGDVAGNETGLSAVDLDIEAFGGSARVTGNAQWSPALSANLDVTGNNMNLSALTGGLATTLDWDVRLTATDADDFNIEIRRLAGSYNGQPVRASGVASREGESWQCRGCDAIIGDNHLRVDLAINKGRLDGAVDIDARALDQLEPRLAGALRAEGLLKGSLDLPILSGDLVAHGLTVEGWSVAAVTIETHSATTESVDVDIQVNGLANGDVALGGGQLSVTGQLDRLQLESSWATEQVRVEYAANLAREDDTLTGRLTEGVVDQADTGQWTLVDPVDFVIAPGSMSVESSQWSNGDTRLDIGRLFSEGGSMGAEIALSAAPLRWLDGRTPSDVTFGGYVDAQLALQQDGGVWTGQVDWRQRGTVLHIDSADGDRFEIAVPVAEANVSLGPSGAQARARLEADGGVEVSFDATANGLSPESVVDAELTASGREWDWVSAFIPEIEEVVGTIDAEFRASGRIDDPQLTGELRLSNGATVLPAFNVPVSDINVRVSGDSTSSLRILGEATAGNGKLAITGALTNLLSSTPNLVLEVRGDEATVLDWPDYVLVASSDLSLSGAGNEYQVDGHVRLDRAEIQIRELPEGAVSPSDDVTVLGREESATRATRLTGAIDIELTDSVHVRAFGLDTHLEGELRITLPAGREPRANGEISLVGGSFEMYGQRLEIERGTMLFSGALDNPFVDVRVVRSIDGAERTIEVGMDITGRAEALVSTLYSEPPMSEAEILSYLVTGRPLEQAGSVDGQLMSDAAFSLGLRQATAITNQIGQSVGLDELALEGANQDAAALVAGKQISPNLYARYRYGVFSSLGELLLRYSLTEALSVELGAGEFQSLDIQYTIERD